MTKTHFFDEGRSGTVERILSIHYTFQPSSYSIAHAALSAVIRETRIVNALLRNGVTSITDLVANAEPDLLRMTGIGIGTVESIRLDLALRGFYLRGERPAQIPAGI